MTELIYDAFADAPGLRPDGVWSVMLAVAMVQSVFLLPAFVGLGWMRARPWSAAQRTTLGATNGWLFSTLFAAGFLMGPLVTMFLAIPSRWPFVARWGFASEAILGVLFFYPAFAAFRSMIPGARGEIGDGPPYQVAARGPAFGMLAIGLVAASLILGGVHASRKWDEVRSLARGEHLTAVGTLDRVTVSSTEQHARRSVWFEEHDTLTLGSGAVFEAVCTRRVRELAASGRPYTCLRANIGDGLTVTYRNKASPHQPAAALRIWRDGTDHS